MKARIDPATASTLGGLEYLPHADGAAVRIKAILTPRAYRRVNAVLEALGARWSPKSKLHLFKGTATELREAILKACGAGRAVNEVKAEKKKNAWFPTPLAIADFMAMAAGCKGKRVLEPSAGEGALVQAALDNGAASVVAIECQKTRWEKLKGIPRVDARLGDFLVAPVEPFDVILMNPPFTRRTDIRHVLRASQFLAPGGRLIAIMADRGEGSIPGGMTVLRKLPAGTFEGTDVATIIVKGEK